ncbi:hypothetical protein AYO45_06250 [Gammaproteobacteria bacterium SCGC AG-212-F23]|nr:hypothetical protein AYO45_06250 [Gammaproteobacteria bacterium SCGC AG-212-F23]
MKIKWLTCFLITTALSANTFAVDITKGRVLEHKEWTTGNARIFFNNANAKKAVAFSSQHHQLKKAANNDTDTASFRDDNDNAPTSYVYAGTQPASGVVGKSVDIKGENFAYVVNTTNQKQLYYYYSSLCVMSAHPSPNQNDCAYYRDSIELDPAGEANFSEGPVLQVVMDHADNFKTTIITGMNGVGGTTQLSSEASGVLTVTADNK